MNTPICDFVNRYIEKNALRLHMPGHKGAFGYDADITEVPGADSLYEAVGIIRESEENASALFGGHTFYSTEGSSHTIRAMLYLFRRYCEEKGCAPRILAGRNAHKTFTSAAALLDLEIKWLYPQEGKSYLSCTPDAAVLKKALEGEDVAAVYITSPDYLGNMADLRALSYVCHERDVLLLVDNAHGAYLRFLSPSCHPLDLGADMCCDSAHKTLPVLTGGAYLHIHKSAPACFASHAKAALALFGSTSPSYLILESLDRANRYLSEGYRKNLKAFADKVATIHQTLCAHGYALLGAEPLKLTIDAKKYGYTGYALSRILEDKNIVCEFADPDYVVLMLTPETGEDGLEILSRALLSVPQKAEILQKPPAFCRPEKVLSPREAIFSPSETVPAAKSAGKVLAEITVGCPPAVPILVSGERISEEMIAMFQYYGIQTCSIVKRAVKKVQTAKRHNILTEKT